MVNFDTSKEQIEGTLNNDNGKQVTTMVNTPALNTNTEISYAEYKGISIQIHDLENQVRVWRKKREELNSQVIDKTKLRNQKNEEVKNIITLANEDKKLRDDLNERISELKNQKHIIDIQLKENEKSYEAAESKLEPVEMPKNMNSQLKKYQREIKDLEWKLQTQTFLLVDERVIVDRISNLDEKINGLSEFKNLSKEKIKSYHTVRKLKNQMYKTIREMNGLVKESRLHHKKMVESFSKANTVRKEADSIHAEIQKIKTQADLIHSEFIEKIKLKRTLSNKIKKYSQKIQAEQKSKETEARKEKTSNVLQKTKDGKKISFDDFKSLIDLGLI